MDILFVYATLIILFGTLVYLSENKPIFLRKVEKVFWIIGGTAFCVIVLTVIGVIADGFGEYNQRGYFEQMLTLLIFCSVGWSVFHFFTKSQYAKDREVGITLRKHGVNVYEDVEIGGHGRIRMWQNSSGRYYRLEKKHSEHK